MSPRAPAGRSLLIIGCGGHARVVGDVARQVGLEEQTFIDTTGKASTFQGQPVGQHLPQNYSGLFFVAVGDNAIRQTLYEHFLAANPGATAPALIHPSSVIGSECTIGPGSVVMPLCAVNAGSHIGTGVIVNTRASIDHDCSLHNFSSVAPGCVMAGQAKLGQRSALCLASAVSHQIAIGDDVVVGAMSFVNRDLPGVALVSWTGR